MTTKLCIKLKNLGTALKKLIMVPISNQVAVVQHQQVSEVLPVWFSAKKSS
jgi:hypothetical protein